MSKIPLSEIMWSSFHLGEDRKTEDEKVRTLLELLLSFINPQLFKEYRKKMNEEEIVSDTFEADILSRTGMSSEEAFKRARESGDDLVAETIEPDVFGEPIITSNG